MGKTVIWSTKVTALLLGTAALLAYSTFSGSNRALGRLAVRAE